MAFVLVSLASAQIGTREDPIPMGTTANLGDGWQISVLCVIPDATNIVLGENSFNKQPKAGDLFFLARVQAKYTGPNSATFSGSYRLRAVGPSSIGYSTFENSPGVIPDPIPDSEVFTGGVIQGYVGWEIKSSDANALVMYDNPISVGGNNNRVYMALYTTSATTALANKELYPQSAAAWFNKGRALWNQSKYNESLQALNKAIELKPDLAEAWEVKGLLLGLLGRCNESIQAIDKAIELKPDLVGAQKSKELVLKLCTITVTNEGISLMNKAGALFNQGKYDEAIKTSDEALEINQSFKEAWVCKGFALSKLGKYNESIESFNKAIEINQSYKDAWRGKGDALALQGKYDEAIKYYNDAIKIDPQYADAWHNKGLAIEALGRTSEANTAKAKAKEWDEG
jgi:tetratricopeptide (TPR) repeat protein